MKWEYKVMLVGVKGLIFSGLPEEIVDKLDEYGAESWELVRVEPILRKGLIAGAYTDSFALFFKRPAE
jgi:hypothetical protein